MAGQDEVFNWFESYLTIIKRQVKCGKSLAETQKQEYGVPQRTVLFFVYIDNMKSMECIVLLVIRLNGLWEIINMNQNLQRDYVQTGMDIPTSKYIIKGKPH